MDPKVKQFMDKVVAKNPSEKEFHQAVMEVVETVLPFIDEILSIKMLKFLTGW